MEIDKVAARNKLPVRREPYWKKLSAGCYVGYRKMTASPDGTWLARYRDDGLGKQLFETFGKLDTKPDHQRFDLACELAREWFKHLGAGGSTEKLTVAAACASYAKHIEHHKSLKAADDLRARYNRWIDKDPIGSIELTKLTRDHVKKWRRTLVDTPVKVGKSGSIRERSKETVNRDITALRAALNHAKEDGHVTTDFAWQLNLKPFKNSGKRRNTYLTMDDRLRLVSHSPSPDFAEFLRGLILIPLRPGALAELKVGNFDARLGTLTIGKDKSGEERKVKLPEASSQFFQHLTKDKPLTAPIFIRADGKAWNKDAWKSPMKEAAEGAGLPPQTVAYTLRHCGITDMVVDKVDLLTVAQISATSVAMIQKHYGHLRDDIASAALAKLAVVVHPA